VTATLDLVKALKAYADAVEASRELLKVVALPKKLAWIARYAAPEEPIQDYDGHVWAAEPDEPERDLADLRDAWEVVDLNLPVADAAPHSRMRANEPHRRWRGPLEPQELLHMAQIATPDAPGYRAQLRENTAYFEARANQGSRNQEIVCGRPNKDGSPCGVRPLYAPGAGWKGGLGCWRHVTGAEKAALDRAYAQAIAEHDCPGCVGKAGKSCHTGEDAARYMRLLANGEWAKVRSYGDYKVHDARLDLVEFGPSLA
jgi:hypothetical protein